MSDDEGAGAGPPPEVHAEGEGGGGRGEEIVQSYPLIRFADLPEDTKLDIVEFVTATAETYASDPEMACKAIKEKFDKRYSPGWNAVIGESFSFDVCYDLKNIVHVFSNGTIGILVWRCSPQYPQI